MARVLEHLLCKYKALSSNSNTTQKKVTSVPSPHMCDFASSFCIVLCSFHILPNEFAHGFYRHNGYIMAHCVNSSWLSI
jgi:hypothetical protein